MMVAVEKGIRRLRLLLRQLWGSRRVRTAAEAVLYAGGGFAASAARLRGSPQPLALGLILSRGDWRGLCLCLGSVLGFRVLWGSAGEAGFWWCLGGGLLGLLELPPKRRPLLAGALVGVTAAVLSFFRRGAAGYFPLQMAVAAFSTWVFASRERLHLRFGAGLGALALASPLLFPGLGYVLGGALAAHSSFPAAALAGLGLDLAGSAMPMTALLCLAWLGRLIPGSEKLRWLYGVFGWGLLWLLTGMGEWRILPALALGGVLGLALPKAMPRRSPGEIGRAQVRLELAAEVMGSFREQLRGLRLPDIDREALLQRLRSRSCGHCAMRKTCLEQQRLTTTVLEDTREFPCRRPGRLRWELLRTREQLRLLKADRRRREEYRQTLLTHYSFLGEYLRALADSLPQEERSYGRYSVTVGVRTRGRELTNGDKWAAFRGSGSKFFVLLCDGMGTGTGAGEEGRRACVILRAALAADLPPEYAFRSINAMLALENRAGAVTLDLAEIRLDTGQTRIFKWGAAPSYRVRAGRAEKIGTAGPPPGLAVTPGGETVERLSLKGGELLILISDGVDGEEVSRRVYMAPDAPPGELAERLLEGGSGKEADDATAVVIRLNPGNLAPS